MAMDSRSEFHLTAGQTHESSVMDELLVAADECLLDEDGERIAWPFALGGDKGYRADWIDAYLLDLGIEPVIPSKENEIAQPGQLSSTKRHIAAETSSNG